MSGVVTTATPAPVRPAASAAERFHALDALRAFAMLLGVYLHAAVPYMVLRPDFWPEHLNDAYQNPVHDGLVFLIHCFRMELFFLMAGFFGHLVMQRKGLASFVRHRGLRIGVPFVAGWGLMIVLLPISVGWRPFTDPRYLLPAHLWFLYYLLVYCAAAALLVRVYPMAGQFALGKGPVPRTFAKVVSSPFAAVALAALTLPWMLAMQTPVVDTPLAFWPIPRVTGYYGVFFAVGWMLHRQKDLLASIERWRWVSVGGAALLTVPLLVLVEIGVRQWQAASGESGEPGVLTNTPAVVGLRAVYSVYTWLLVFALTGLFLRYLKGHRPAVRYVADSAYWVYIMHLPLVLFLQWQLSGTSVVPGPLKVFAILAVSLAVLLGTYQLFVRHTVIGWVLNGPRERKLGSSAGA